MQSYILKLMNKEIRRLQEEVFYRTNNFFPGIEGERKTYKVKQQLKTAESMKCKFKRTII